MPFQKGHAGGPGRPRKADKNAGAVAKAEKQIRDRLPALIENMMLLADGIYVEEITIEGVRIVYKRPPDRQANEYLINRVMGKPTERQEVSGPDGSAIEVRTFDYTAAAAKIASGSGTDRDESGED